MEMLHAFKDDAVHVSIKVVRLQPFHGQDNGIVAEEHGAENSLFSFDILRWHPLFHTMIPPV